MAPTKQHKEITRFQKPPAENLVLLWSSRLCLLVALAFNAVADADILDLGIPRDIDGDNGSGSFSSFGPNDKERAGIVFDVEETFTIEAIGLAAGVDGVLNIEVSIYEVESIPFPAPLDPTNLSRHQVKNHSIGTARGALLANTSAVPLGKNSFFLDEYLHPDVKRKAVNKEMIFRYFDVPLNFTFLAGHRYEIHFEDISIASGTCQRRSESVSNLAV